MRTARDRQVPVPLTTLVTHGYVPERISVCGALWPMAWLATENVLFVSPELKAEAEGFYPGAEVGTPDSIRSDGEVVPEGDADSRAARKAFLDGRDTH